MPELELARPVPLRLWLLAGIGAVALHVAGIALAVAHLRTDDEEALGAPAIEIGLELASPRAEPTDLPPGPEQEASAASPPVQEQKAVTEQSELPRDTPVETDDPDRVVTENKSTKPPQEEPVVAAVETAPSEQSVAAEASAMPPVMAALESAHSITPAQGIGESANLVRLTWQKELAAHFDHHKRYPADRVNKAAEIVVSFVLDRTGHILSSSVVRSSGDASFDEAALAMLKRSDPVPPPPPLIADEGLTFTLPVIFRVRGAK
jgi:TonB family protein